MRICNEKETGEFKESKKRTRVPKTVKMLYNQSYMDEDYHSNSLIEGVSRNQYIR